MTMNDQAKKDLSSYIKQTIKSASALLLLILLGIVLAWYRGNTLLLTGLLGALLGTALATTNLFSLGYAFFNIAIKKGPMHAILWPLASFLAMCGSAFMLAVYLQTLLVGFALGLTAPVILGAMVIFLTGKPA